MNLHEFMKKEYMMPLTYVATAEQQNIICTSYTDDTADNTDALIKNRDLWPDDDASTTDYKPWKEM